MSDSADHVPGMTPAKKKIPKNVLPLATSPRDRVVIAAANVITAVDDPSDVMSTAIVDSPSVVKSLRDPSMRRSGRGRPLGSLGKRRLHAMNSYKDKQVVKSPPPAPTAAELTAHLSGAKPAVPLVLPCVPALTYDDSTRVAKIIEAWRTVTAFPMPLEPEMVVLENPVLVFSPEGWISVALGERLTPLSVRRSPTQAQPPAFVRILTTWAEAGVLPDQQAADALFERFASVVDRVHMLVHDLSLIPFAVAYQLRKIATHSGSEILAARLEALSRVVGPRIAAQDVHGSTKLDKLGVYSTFTRTAFARANAAAATRGTAQKKSHPQAKPKKAHTPKKQRKNRR